MLPPGHIAGGYLTAKVLLNFLPFTFSDSQTAQLLAAGALLGFAPDLDMFVSFLRTKSLRLAGSQKVSDNHRKFISHAPLLWFAFGISIFIWSGTEVWQTVGLLIWLASWSHFVLDSLEWGIMWLWPLRKRVYALANREYQSQEYQGKGFIDYWFNYVFKVYARHFSFYLEILIIIIALAIIYA